MKLEDILLWGILGSSFVSISFNIVIFNTPLSVETLTLAPLLKNKQSDSSIAASRHSLFLRQRSIQVDLLIPLDL